MCVWAGLDEEGHVGSIDTFDPTDAVHSGKPGCILHCNKSPIDDNNQDDVDVEVDGGIMTIRFMRLMKPVWTNNNTFLLLILTLLTPDPFSLSCYRRVRQSYQRLKRRRIS